MAQHRCQVHSRRLGAALLDATMIVGLAVVVGVSFVAVLALMWIWISG
jgi:hypothetical protein